MRIPGYRIERLIGKGGMSTVYLAVQESLNRRVALKVLKKFDDPRQAERFLHEGRIIAALNHRNIITIHDIGSIGDRHFIAMEYLEGRSLSERIEEGMPLHKILTLMEQIASCLHFVHRRGIVHRDIKPGNILFHADGTPKLTDFGIAKLLDSDQEITLDGNALGSPYYLSPEQAEGLPLDGRTDIYALGIVFYQMLTGQRPYAKASPVETIVAHLTQPLPVLPEPFQEYQELLEAMIAKQPQDRIASAKELAYRFHDARQVLVAGDQRHGTRPAAPPSTAPVARRAPVWIAAASAAVLAGVLAWRALPPGDSAQGDPPPPAAVIAALPAAPPVQRPPDGSPRPDEVDPRDVAQDRAPPAGEPLAAVVTPPQSVLSAEPLPPTTAGPPSSGDSTALALPAAPGQRRAGARIDALMQAAAGALDGLRLTRPEGDNAYDYFREVLTLDPEHAGARAGIRDIGARYAGMARHALDEGNPVRADRYLRRGREVSPEDPQLAALQAELARAEQPPDEAPRAPTGEAEPPPAAADGVRGRPGSGNIVKDFGRVWRAVFD
ncbi:MAG: protein kinase [Chromatiaceae bacterium]|nr:protein kinase [Gammaproteobacteria bacterium]MCP5300659.1 protein kinase [Chromatiaceae bacterium]MCP5422731.1 protein kinase [Chromatiaceae bacterium]